MPTFFVAFFQSAEDYYQRADIATLLRFIRFLSFFITLLAPSFYVAVTTYHQEMIPTNLVISLAAQRESVPFPAFVEAVLMELTYEILREAGVRIPKNIGQAISIVGTLVIGQAAVAAGFISSAMVIIVSITLHIQFCDTRDGHVDRCKNHSLCSYRTSWLYWTIRNTIRYLFNRAAFGESAFFWHALYESDRSIPFK